MVKGRIIMMSAQNWPKTVNYPRDIALSSRAVSNVSSCWIFIINLLGNCAAIGHFFFTFVSKWMKVHVARDHAYGSHGKSLIPTLKVSSAWSGTLHVHKTGIITTLWHQQQSDSLCLPIHGDGNKHFTEMLVWKIPYTLKLTHFLCDCMMIF